MVSIGNFLSNSSTSSSFFNAFWLLVIPGVTHSSLFYLQNSISLNFSSTVNLLCSSYEDMLYNKHKIFYKYLLHTWATRKSCFKSVFYVQKAKKWCKTLQCFCSILLLQKLNLLQCLIGGPRVASYIHAQRRTFLLRVDEKCCSWPLSFTLYHTSIFFFFICLQDSSTVTGTIF